MLSSRREATVGDFARSSVGLRRQQKRTTESIIAFLRESQMISNVDLGEVQEVDLVDAQGHRRHRDRAGGKHHPAAGERPLASELNIKPKRGVLLAGPPGTGKTTIGRALAHRLQGKFFLIDGTFICGHARLLRNVSIASLRSAKHNAPSVIFIDDSDVIFETARSTACTATC